MHTLSEAVETVQVPGKKEQEDGDCVDGVYV
jgi:hypothetical protein